MDPPGFSRNEPTCKRAEIVEDTHQASGVPRDREDLL